jgi:two-component system, LuxR family, sensor kinase FixL
MAIRESRLQRFEDWLEAHQRHAVCLAIGLAGLIAVLDWWVGANVSLGTFYIFAVVTAAVVMPRSGLLVFAMICAVLREAFGPFRWGPDYEVRLALIGGSFGGMGLLVAELNRNRKLTIQNLRERSRVITAQKESESQLSALIDTSPLPILIAEGSGRIAVANGACQELLELSEDSPGNVFEYLPELKGVVGLRPSDGGRARGEFEGAGIKQSGEPFFAHVWHREYDSAAGPRLVIVLWDASEDLRGREIASAEAAMTASRVLLGGFAHEVRNVLSAVSLLCSRIAGRCRAEEDPEYRALKQTLSGLADLADAGVRLRARGADPVADAGATMQQVRIIVQPLVEASGLKLIWNVRESLPRVWADHSVLIQVFLNLARNSERALAGREDGCFAVEAEVEAEFVTLKIRDNGPGIADAEHLFQPFHSTTGGSGLGLYISRAALRSSGGDLWHEPGREGACFCVRLRRVAED